MLSSLPFYWSSSLIDGHAAMITSVIIHIRIFSEFNDAFRRYAWIVTLFRQFRQLNSPTVNL